MEGEGALDGVELGEVAVEMRVVLVLGREDRRIGAVFARRERGRDLLGLARFGVEDKDGIAAAVVEEPDQGDRIPLAVDRGDDAPVVADRRRDAVVFESLAEIFALREDRGRGQAQGQEKRPGEPFGSNEMHAVLLDENRNDTRGRKGKGARGGVLDICGPLGDVKGNGRPPRARQQRWTRLLSCDCVVPQRGPVMARPWASSRLTRQRCFAHSEGRGVPVAPGAQGLAPCHPRHVFPQHTKSDAIGSGVLFDIGPAG